MQYFADVLLPLALAKPFTYAVTSDDYTVLKPGFRVAVSFGKSKVYSAVVLKLHTHAPQMYTPKFIELILEESPCVLREQLDFWYWLSNYYQSKLGDILRAALPSNFLLESETVVVKKEISEEDKNKLSDDAFLVYQALEIKALSIKEIISILGKKSVFGLLQDLFSRGVVEIHQSLNEKYRPKLIRYVRLSKLILESQNLEEIFDSLKNAPKQKKLIMELFNQNPKGVQWKKSKNLIDKTGSSFSVLSALIRKGLIEEQYLREDRLLYNFKKSDHVRALSDAQQNSVREINNCFDYKSVVLFQGVTGSGKTEVYIELIDQVMACGKQVLYLLPEISLTPQIVKRLQENFGNEVTVYHSKFSINERTEVWNNILEHKGNAKIIVGTRSALFLPFKSLGLVVVDEEHELSYKQFDPSPRYHARDSAIVLARIHNAKVILGSATPSIESSYNRFLGKYGWVQLNERFGKVELPEIITVDLKIANKKKK